MSPGSYRFVSSLGSLEPGTHLCAFHGTRPPDDLGTVADGVRSAAEQSRKRGFPALRVVAQMDALAPLLGSVEEVIRWERMSTDLQREIGISSVCLYDAGRLNDELAALLLDEHARVAPEVDETPLAQLPRGRRALGAANPRRGRHLQPRHPAPHAPVAGSSPAAVTPGPRRSQVRRLRHHDPDASSGVDIARQRLACAPPSPGRDTAPTEHLRHSGTNA